MRPPCCSVCQNLYDEEERCPLLLQCGHGFCKACLSRMFSASLDTCLSCPRCRQVSTVGNSVTALKKNYAILALINDNEEEEDENDGEDDDDGEFDKGRCFSFNNNYDHHHEVMDDDVPRRRRRGAQGSGRIELGSHQGGLKLVRRIGEESGGRSTSSGRRFGVDIWEGVVVGGGVRGGRCRHKVSVKKVIMGEDMDLVWVQGQLEGLMRASMWCRNVCISWCNEDGGW